MTSREGVNDVIVEGLVMPREGVSDVIERGW